LRPGSKNRNATLLRLLKVGDAERDAMQRDPVHGPPLRRRRRCPGQECSALSQPSSSPEFSAVIPAAQSDLRRAMMTATALDRAKLVRVLAYPMTRRRRQSMSMS
jgi:hypothetical protein